MPVLGKTDIAVCPDEEIFHMPFFISHLRAKPEVLSPMTNEKWKMENGKSPNFVRLILSYQRKRTGRNAYPG
jgi:hypothetical protein